MSGNRRLLGVDVDLTVCPSDQGWMGWLRYYHGFGKTKETLDGKLPYNLGELFPSVKDPHQYWREVDDLGFAEAGWECHDFLEIVNIDGIRYSHYFVNPNSLLKNCVGGNIDAKLKNLGWSFSMGHQQTLQYGIQFLPDGESRQGLVAGAFYMHNEGYMGSQGNKSHWRGVVMKNQVSEGKYDPCFVSLKYLLEKYL